MGAESPSKKEETRTTWVNIPSNDPSLNKGVSMNLSDLVERFDNSEIEKNISGVYVLSNESKIEKSIRILEDFNKKDIPSKPKCHIGVGALHNFDIMATRRSDYRVIFDFNPKKSNIY